MIGTSFSTFNNASKVGGLTIMVLFTYSGCEYTLATRPDNLYRRLTPFNL